MALGTTIALIKALGNVTDEQVSAAVDAWLEDNVAQETGYVLDSSLTMSNAAQSAYLLSVMGKWVANPAATA